MQIYVSLLTIVSTQHRPRRPYPSRSWGITWGGDVTHKHARLLATSVRIRPVAPLPRQLAGIAVACIEPTASAQCNFRMLHHDWHIDYWPIKANGPNDKQSAISNVPVSLWRRVHMFPKAFMLYQRGHDTLIHLGRSRLLFCCFCFDTRLCVYHSKNWFANSSCLLTIH